MMKILIATNNEDKYKIVTYLLKSAGLDKYEYYNLKQIGYKDKDEKETGCIAQRAKDKAKSVFEDMKETENIYTYIIGVDDGIELKGVLQPNVKDYIPRILYEDYLENNEKFAFHRAYCIIRNDGKEFNAITINPYKYKKKENVELKKFSYPLSHISVPLNSEQCIADMDEEEAQLYTWSNSKQALLDMIDELKNG